MTGVAERRDPRPAEGQRDVPLRALVEAARAGDRRAFAALYRRHARTVHGVLLARLPRAELRDAMQEVFTTALSKLAGLREPESFSAWLASIARNLARDWHKRRRELSAAPELLDHRRGPSRALDEAIDALAAIRELPESYHELLVLRFVEGLSGREIASALDMSPGSVRVKLHRGVSMLRARLGAESTPGPTRGSTPGSSAKGGRR